MYIRNALSKAELFIVSCSNVQLSGICPRALFAQRAALHWRNSRAAGDDPPGPWRTVPGQSDQSVERLRRSTAD